MRTITDDLYIYSDCKAALWTRSQTNTNTAILPYNVEQEQADHLKSCANQRRSTTWSQLSGHAFGTHVLVQYDIFMHADGTQTINMHDF